MKTQFAITCFVIGAALAPVAAYADMPNTDRSHPLVFVQDSLVTAKVKALLANEKFSSLAYITVGTDNRGAVYLSGNVDSTAEADRAISIARAAEGVTSVSSSLQVKPIQ